MVFEIKLKINKFFKNFISFNVFISFSRIYIIWFDFTLLYTNKGV